MVENREKVNSLIGKFARLKGQTLATLRKMLQEKLQMSYHLAYYYVNDYIKEHGLTVSNKRLNAAGSKAKKKSGLQDVVKTGSKKQAKSGVEKNVEVTDGGDGGLVTDVGSDKVSDMVSHIDGGDGGSAGVEAVA